ncbi:MAG: transcription antitermination factor NusB [Eggerthellaceae bacterium]|jgi:N utilization substance protein B
MPTKRHERTMARRQAIQVLYQGEILDTSPIELLDRAGAFIDDVNPAAYAVTLIRGVADHQNVIDEQIQSSSENWALDRMPAVDRAILRLACFEMLYLDSVPVSVSINEAVDLAKEFGGEDDSPKFINGVLGRIATLLEEGKIDVGAPGGASSDAVSEAEEGSTEAD